jgi:hypothetical protein
VVDEKSIGFGIDILRDVLKIDSNPIMRNKPRSVSIKWSDIRVPNNSIIINKDSLYFKESSLGSVADIFPNRISGAASVVGNRDDTIKISSNDLKEMVDPYQSSVRDDFANSSLNDPLIAPALERRIAACWEDDFELVLEPKFQDDTGDQSGTGKILTLAQQATNSDIETESIKEPGQKNKENKIPESVAVEYQGYLEKLKVWKDEENIKLLTKMRNANKLSLVQGRNATLIYPPISKLSEGQLPDVLKNIPYEDLGSPVVDTGLTWAVVAIRSSLGNKQILMRDELVYVTRRDDGLRKDSAYYGASILEPIITMSRILKRILNYDLGKLAISSYFTKLAINLMTRGSEAEQTEQIKNFNRNLFSTAVDVITLNAGTVVTPISTAVNGDPLDQAHEIILNHMITNLGVTKSQMMRELNMNRDIATVQEITFIKYTRKQDEGIIGQAFENQLLNPLLAHLAGVKFSECPYRVKIKRIEIDDTGDEIEEAEVQKEAAQEVELQNNLQDKKKREIESSNLRQEDGNKISGASLFVPTERELDLMEEQIQVNKDIAVELKKLNNTA